MTESCLVAKGSDQLLGHRLGFKICLAVEIFGLHVQGALSFSGFDDNHVCREKLVVSDSDQVAYFNFAPFVDLECLDVSVVNFCERAVLIVVFPVSFEILVCVLDHGQNHDEYERGQHGRLSLGDGDNFNHLHERDDEEVEIGHFGGELLKQIVRHEGPPGVLGRAH